MDLQIKKQIELIEEISWYVKANMLKTIQHAKTGHVESCCSNVELMTTLYFGKILMYDINNFKHPDRDYVLTRGHLGPLRYNIFAMLGWLKVNEMFEYCQRNSRLPKYEDMKITPGVDFTPSGSFGMLLSFAIGIRISLKVQKRSNRVFCFLGDGEEQDGMVLEAAQHANAINLDGLIVIINVNTNTKINTNIDKLWESYGWKVFNIAFGHLVQDIYQTYKSALEYTQHGPVCIIARTMEGNEIPTSISNYGNMPNRSIQEAIQICLNHLPLTPPTESFKIRKYQKIFPNYNHRKSEFHTSYDYLEEFLFGLFPLGMPSQEKLHRNIYILTAGFISSKSISNSKVFNIPYINYIDVGFRVQHLIGMAHGIYKADENAIIILIIEETFVYRCIDQINAVAQSGDHLVIYSVQTELGNEQNVPTGCLLTIPNVEIYEPCTKTDWFYAMNEATKIKKIKNVNYIRTFNGPTREYFNRNMINSNEILEGNYYRIQIGNFKPMYAIVCCGSTVENGFEAAFRMYRKYNISSIFINIVKLSDLDGIWIYLEGMDVFVFYNGSSSVLSSILSREILINGFRVCQIHENDLIGETEEEKNEKEKNEEAEEEKDEKNEEEKSREGIVYPKKHINSNAEKIVKIIETYFTTS